MADKEGSTGLIVRAGPALKASKAAPKPHSFVGLHMEESCQG